MFKPNFLNRKRKAPNAHGSAATLNPSTKTALESDSSDDSDVEESFRNYEKKSNETKNLQDEPEYGFSLNPVDVFADESSQSDSESDTFEEFNCECEDEDTHTCFDRDDISCPICRQGGDWDWYFLSDHAFQEHSLDTNCFGDESWKLARKTF